MCGGIDGTGVCEGVEEGLIGKKLGSFQSKPIYLTFLQGRVLSIRIL